MKRRLQRYLTLGSISGVVNQMRPPQISDFGGGGLQSPIYVNGVSGECFVYVNGVITPINSINVTSFGADPTGVRDSTAAIQAAADYVRLVGGGVVYFPPGTYLISKSIRWGSNTTIVGAGAASVIKASAAFDSTNIVFTNFNQLASVITDSNITIRDLAFFVPPASINIAPIYIRKASVISVLNCRFQNGSDGTAFLACKDTLVQGCRAYDFHNCAWDHWESPQQARVIGCYAESASSVQIVNFNPEDSTGFGGGAADGFTLTGCQFKYTGVAAVGAQIEPLAAGSTVKNVVITGNKFGNVLLAMRGATSNVAISGNTFSDIAGTNASIVASPLFAGTGANFSINGNVISGSNASGGASAIICNVNGYAVDGNTVTTGGSMEASLDITGFVGSVGANNFAAGTTGLGIRGTTGWPAWNAVAGGIGFQNSWVDFAGGFATVAYYKDFQNTVHLRGLMKSGTLTLVAFQLPVGYRPSASLLYPTVSNSALGLLQISNDGSVSPLGGSNVNFSLDGVTFRAD